MKRLTIILSAAMLYLGFMSVSYAHDNLQHVPKESRSATQMTKAAAILIKDLSPSQRKLLILPFANDALRTKWSNAPVSSKSRNGLPIGRLTIKQRYMLHDLLIASTSTQGYQKIWAAIRGDDELKLEGESRELSSEKFFGKNQSLGAIDYWVSFYGDPTTDKQWSYMITGHHLAANFSVIDDKATFVPMFYGSDPARISHGAHAGHQFLPQDRRRGVELSCY